MPVSITCLKIVVEVGGKVVGRLKNIGRSHEIMEQNKYEDCYSKNVKETT